MSRSIQQSFNPADHCFTWTVDGSQYGWYEWNGKLAHSQALKARNAAAKVAKAHGKSVKCWSSPGQMITRGGIGSNHPEINMFVTVYHLDIQ